MKGFYQAFQDFRWARQGLVERLSFGCSIGQCNREGSDTYRRMINLDDVYVRVEGRRIPEKCVAC